MQELDRIFNYLEDNLNKGITLDNQKRRAIKAYMRDEKKFHQMLDHLKSSVHADLREISLLIHEYDSDVIKKHDLKGKRIVLTKMEKLQARFKILSVLSSTYVNKFYDKKDISTFGKYCRTIADDLEKLKDKLKPGQTVNPWDIFSEIKDIMKHARKDFDEAILDEFEHSLVNKKPSIFHILPEEWRARPLDKKLDKLFKLMTEQKEASEEEAEKIRQYDTMITAMIERPKTLFGEINKEIRESLFRMNYVLIYKTSKGKISVKDYEDIKDWIFDIRKKLLKVSKLCRQYNREYGGEVFTHMSIYCRNIAKHLVYNYYATIRRCKKREDKNPKFHEVAMGKPGTIRPDVSTQEFKEALEKAFRQAAVELDKEYQGHIELNHNLYTRKSQLDKQYKDFQEAA